MQEKSLYPSPSRSKPSYCCSGRLPRRTAAFGATPPRAPKFGAILNSVPPRQKTIEGHVRAASLLGLAALLAIVWVVSFVIFHVAGWLIHILLLLALVFLLLQLFTGRPTRL
jgi:hypothetical protein